MNYVTHMRVPDMHLLWFWGVIVEGLVDRSHGAEVNSQWCQKGGSIVLSRALIHCFNLSDAYKKGFAGWYRVDKKHLVELQLMVQEKLMKPDSVFS